MENNGLLAIIALLLCAILITLLGGWGIVAILAAVVITMLIVGKTMSSAIKFLANRQRVTAPPPASLIRRLMAMIYDAFLLLGITFVYGVVVFLLRKLFGDDTLQAPHGALQAFILLGLLLCWAFFYVWCWQRSGQTLGMKSWRIQLQAEDGSLPDWKICWIRCLLAPISLAALGIGYFWCLFDKNGDCLHDKWSHSRTLLLPKPAKKKKA